MWLHNFTAAGLVEQLPNFVFLLLGVVERRSSYEVHSGLKVIIQPKLAMSPYFFCFRIQSEGDTGVCHPPNFPSHFFITLWGGTLGAIWLWSLAPILPSLKVFLQRGFHVDQYSPILLSVWHNIFRTPCTLNPTPTPIPILAWWLSVFPERTQGSRSDSGVVWLAVSMVRRLVTGSHSTQERQACLLHCHRERQEKASAHTASALLLSRSSLWCQSDGNCTASVSCQIAVLHDYPEQKALETLEWLTLQCGPALSS